MCFKFSSGTHKVQQYLTPTHGHSWKLTDQQRENVRRQIAKVKPHPPESSQFTSSIFCSLHIQTNVCQLTPQSVSDGAKFPLLKNGTFMQTVTVHFPSFQLNFKLIKHQETVGAAVRKHIAPGRLALNVICAESWRQTRPSPLCLQHWRRPVGSVGRTFNTLWVGQIQKNVNSKFFNQIGPFNLWQTVSL